MFLFSFYSEYGLFGILLCLRDTESVRSVVFWELVAVLLGLLAGRLLPQKRVSILLIFLAAAAGTVLLLKSVLFGIEEAQMMIPLLGEYLLVGAAVARLTLHKRRSTAVP